MSIRLTGMNSGLDTDAMVQDLINAYNKKKVQYKGEQKKLSWKQDAWKELNTKVKNFFSKAVSNMRFSSNLQKKKTLVSDSSIASVVSSDNAVEGKQSLRVQSLAQSAYLTGGKIETTEQGGATSKTKLSELGFSGNDTITLTKGNGTTITIDVSGDMTVGQFTSTVSAAGLNANFDEKQGRLYISAQESGEKNDFSFGGNTAALASLGLTEETGATKIDAADATITLNGVEYTSENNTFSINGLTITVREKTKEDSFVTLTTEADFDAAYDTIRNFIKEYNSLVNEMDKLYNAASADKYKMLSDEEKDAMSDEEVKEWEDKIKSALLRRDSTISTISNTLRMTMLKTYDIDGKTLSLSSFGISTMSYFLAADNEKNALHIDGNPDDPDTMGEADKLKSALAADPKSVTSFFQQLASDLYSGMTKLSSSNSYRSFGNFYEDKKLKKESDEWEKKISDYEAYIAKIEDKYYKQFTQMEKALSQIQSQQNYISQLLGN